VTEEEYLERINEELDFYEEWWYYDTVKEDESDPTANQSGCLKPDPEVW